MDHSAIMSKANVIGAGIGNKYVKGKNTKKKAVVVFVQKKVPLANLAAKDIIPKSIKGLVTDVIECKQFKALGLTAKVRPTPGGYSVGHVKVTAGTLGGWFRSKYGIVGLSNNHVIACQNAGRPGHIIVQPGVYDSRVWIRNKIGTLKGYVKLTSTANYQDSAVFVPYSNIVTPVIYKIGYLGRFVQPYIGMAIQKVGRTTINTKGSIIAIGATVRVWYSNTVSRIFKDQIIADNKSAGGDSGSLLLDMQSNVVGLLFAGNGSITVYNKIDYVKNAYSLEIIKNI